MCAPQDQRQQQQPYLATDTIQNLFTPELNANLPYAPSPHLIDPVYSNTPSFSYFQSPASEQVYWFQNDNSVTDGDLIPQPGYHVSFDDQAFHDPACIIDPFAFDGGATYQSITSTPHNQNGLDTPPEALSILGNLSEPYSTSDNFSERQISYAYQANFSQHSLQTVANSPSPFSQSISPDSPAHMPTTKSTTSPGSTMSTTTTITTQPNSAIRKRKLNTLAARRYRQKRVDQVTELETALKNTQRERDDLSVRVARLEGELGALRQMLNSGK
ncbi:hypothetical protein GMDG_00987 [Pseudogymnoascus destructans 20631-21]|uniref:BZIP domain-containing protein n=1 Tax=Pseudogymnoascus destructans (strain ATCC MYA-4855 / 20631-21) TaxID=658429 RepID=L8FNS1_PSED2|nr:hypothetical protein GMDG_00987 [Pseudogymnoascus destructans 20631-21]